MTKKIAIFFAKPIVYSLIIMGIGMAIRFLFLDSKTSIQDVLFWVGAVPIALLSIGSIGDFFGRANISYQLSRSVSTRSSNQRAIQDYNDNEYRSKSGLNWIIAGIFVWTISYLI